MPSTIAPSGYMLKPIREGGEFTLYRGRQRGNPSPVLVVALAAEQPLPESLRRLEHEYSLAAELDPAWAAKPLALTRHEGRTILVLKDPGGEPLDQLLERAQGQPLELTRVLCVAIGLASALGQVHRHGLIHKDIKPGNVLVNEVGDVWLIGFGIASQLPRERQSPAPPEIIAGTLAYMAPEQTGRMNRSIDPRSDLYSLGITLYEMLTSTLPFAAADPLEWVHCHIARQPVPPADSAAVPEPLSAMVMKLLAKNAEERYQTASGLEADLRQCLAQWQSDGRIDGFPLGAHDGSDRLLIPERLYGREREIDALLASFDRVVINGTPELVLVSGYSGIGKSSVVHELHKALVPPRGLFASGKFDQYKRDIPYATLAQAFQGLVRPLLGRNEAELGRWQAALSESLSPNGQLIVDLVPELELVIGTQPPVAELPPQDAKNRFRLVFRRFLGVFARPEHPLALFLDDLQWLDSATLDLLEDLVTHSEVRHLLLVGAYRDNEVGPAHPLLRTIEATREAGGRVQEIVLAPLGLDGVEQLVADALHCEPEHGRPLAQLVHEKTGGNPFFTIQFFTALAEEGLLGFDPVTRAWQWDVNRIRAENYTDNVVNLMVGKLKRFSATTQDVLKQFACLGNVVEIATLTMVLRETEEAIDASLLEGVHAGLVFKHENAYKFLHDRIQQAAYSLIPEDRRADIHLRIGRALLASMTANQLAEHLFDVANQLNRGSAMLIDRDEKAQAATIDLRAGQKAKASAAFVSASVYLAAGIALLDEAEWECQYHLMFRLRLERAECEFLTGELEQAEQLLAELLQRGTSKTDLAAVYDLKVLLHIVKSENPQAVDSALACLKLFGIDIPAHPSWEQVQAEYETVWRNLEGRSIENLIDLPLMNDPELQAATRVLCALSNSAYVTDANLFCLGLCRTLNLSIQNGVNGASAHACGYLGFSLGPAFQRYSEGFRLAKLGCDLVEKHGFLGYRAKVKDATAIAAFWTHPLATAIDFVRASLRSAIETGDLTYACYGMLHIVMLLLVRNDPLDAVWRESEVVIDFLHKSKFRDMEDSFVPQQRFIAAMQGRPATWSTFSDAQFEAAFEAQDDRMPCVVCWYWIAKAKARFLSGAYVEALAAAEKAKALLWSSTAHIPLLDYYYYAALTVAAVYENGSADEQQGWRDLLTAHREQLREWAENYPPTFADKHLLVLAEIARVEKRDAEALRLYEEAIHLARENGFVQNEGLAHELAALYCLAHGLETAGYAHLRNASNCYHRWGAFGKVKQLDERYPRLQEARDSTSPTATIGTPAEHLDLATVVKVSQTVSGEIVLKRLIETLMVTALQHAGAERGLLILLRGDQMQIEAEATTDRDTIAVRLPAKLPTSSELPDTVFQHILRTKETVIIDDASSKSHFSGDPYFTRARARSILCLPLLKQATLTGVLYLENSLASHVFTPTRIAVLKLLASQAAISLENASLYSDLHRSEAFLAQGQSISHTGSFGWNVVSGEIYWSKETYNIFEHDQAAKPTLESILQRTHPDDRDLYQQTLNRMANEKTNFDFAQRLLMLDGSVKHLHVSARALNTLSGNLEFVGAVTDITAAKQAEAKIRQSESDLRQLLDLTPQHISVLGPQSRLYANQAVLDYHGVTLEEWQNAGPEPLFHPEDYERVMRERQSRFVGSSSFELEARLRRRDGQYCWFLFRYSPTLDEQGRPTRWYVAGTDIEDRKQTEQRLQNENVALREEIDRASMFEEIVGISPALHAVLSRVSKVAPTDSSVLITGETGTGKELLARAIHRRSRRSSRAFVSVNCAAIPRDLIASELFGHEKGAFTGAAQRRLGRFELAQGGTIFLDEVGELPPETQIALLRVLQEHEFERVGGTGSIRTDVRVIAATNRDLEAAIVAGIFRNDLFYRLNVFPIELPPLRERREDISLLVEYFIDRYARKAGKRFHAVTKKSLDLLQSYPWPGNIRELQNVIERSVIVCETENFSVDESWISRQPVTTTPSREPHLHEKLSSEEKAIIEAALRESGGRVYGPSGAAATLGIPRSTLESKIRSLKINKNQFKTGAPSKNA
jgi:PAS domain S-box-containing protein